MSKRSSHKKKGSKGDAPADTQSVPDLLSRGRRTPELRRKQMTSPRASPLLRRLSTFIKHKGKRKAKHEFETLELVHPTWCDYCDDIIWGLWRGCVRCKVCMTTCHSDCEKDISLVCKPVSQRKNISGGHVHPRQAKQGVDIGAQGLLAYLTAGDVRAKIKKYNSKRDSNFIELLDEEDASAKRFKGFLRVTLNLTRPIRVSNEDTLSISSDESNLSSLSRPLHHTHSRLHRTSSNSRTIVASRTASSSGSSSSSGRHDGDTSFFIPKPVSKGLFVTSASTAQEVIGILLKKFQVTSNPRKFALFEKNLNTGSERRLRRFEEPLALQLLWGDESDQFILSLKEHNSEYEFPWEEFSLVELGNFLNILDKEEAEASKHIQASYDEHKRQLEELLASMGSSPPDTTSSSHNDTGVTQAKPVADGASTGD